MSLALLIAAVASVGSAEPEVAASPTWTLGVTGSYARTEDLDTDTGSAGVFLEYGATDWFAGGSLSSTSGDAIATDTYTPADGRGITGSAWAGWISGDWTLDVSLSLTRQDLDGEALAGPDAPPSLQGRTVEIDGETFSSSLSLGVARGFHFDAISVTPHARVAWDQVTTEATASLAGSPGNGLAVDSDASGASGSAGVTFAVAPADWLSLHIDASGVYASSEAASAYTLSGRTRQARPAAGEDEGAGWAEFSGGVTIFAPSDITVALSGGATAGRDAEDVFASVSLSKTF
jgi:hypothetical protein